MVGLLQSRSLSFYLLLLSIHPSIHQSLLLLVLCFPFDGVSWCWWRLEAKNLIYGMPPDKASIPLLLHMASSSETSAVLIAVSSSSSCGYDAPPLPIAKESMRDSRSPLFFWCLVFFSLSHHGKLLHLPCPLPSYPLFGWLKAIASPSFDRSGLLISYKQLIFFLFCFDCTTCSVKSS